MAKIKNKEILQSYVLTTAKYDFSAYEKRILYKIIEQLQDLIDGKKLNYNYSIQEGMFKETKKFIFPFSAFKKHDEDKNHKKIKSALLDLENKVFEYEDNDIWKTIRIIYLPKVFKNKQYISFELSNDIINCFLDFSKGFRKYELKISMQFKSRYSMRFYELFSNQKKPINYSIDALKEMFQVENKYNDNHDFVKNVVIPAKKELDRCSPYTFHFEPLKTGRKITSIHFVPIYQPQFEDEELKRQKLNKNMSNRWFIPKNIDDYLKYNFEFTTKELKNNLTLFENLYNHLSEEALLDFLVELRPITVHVDNPKAYIIGALQKKSSEVRKKE